jgi:hypothetical protein
MKLYLHEAFLRRFPDSHEVLTFPRVAFNRDLTEAFFYTEHLCGFCGEGKFVFMMWVPEILARFFRKLWHDLHRLEIIEPQPVGEFAGIDLVSPVALVERRVLARVARQHMGYMRFE